MGSVHDKVVTLASFLPDESQAKARESVGTTEDKSIDLAAFEQIRERIKQESLKVGPDIFVAVPDRDVSLAQSKIARDGDVTKALANGGQEVKFGTGKTGGDWFGWALSVLDWVKRRDAHHLKRPISVTAETLPDVAHVALAADWGTGLYGAPKIAESIRALSRQKPFDVLMHLGDVYYSGTKDEVRDRFLAFWPTEAAKVNRALNSNHEMYSGGFGYFELTLPTFKQDSSYFAMRNAHWLLIGLDTAYVDHDMDNEQVAWLNLVLDKLRENRKVVFFSHQQPYSVLADQGPKLQRALMHRLEEKKITAWYWGHEHECIIYDRHPKWELLGRCLGNGGVPEPRKGVVKNAPTSTKHPGAGQAVWKELAATADVPGAIVLDGPNLDLEKESDQKRFSPHGFVTLEFNGPTLIERVRLSDSTELYTNTIT